MKLWRYEWASLEVALAAAGVAFVGLVYVVSRAVGWLSDESKLRLSRGAPPFRPNTEDGWLARRMPAVGLVHRDVDERERGHTG